MDDAAGCGALQPIGVDMAHHIMTAFFLPLFRIRIIDVFRMGNKLVDLLLCYIQTLIALSLSQSDPQLAPGFKLVVIGEDVLHLPAGIPGGKRADVSVVIQEKASLQPEIVHATFKQGLIFQAVHIFVKGIAAALRMSHFA